MRTLQEIYDFCKSDATFRAYYDAPKMLGSTPAQYRYYHAELGDDRTRRGSFLFSQSRTQLMRFLGSDLTDFYFHVDVCTGELVSDAFCGVPNVYVVVNIDGGGVRMSITHPFNRAFEDRRIVFTARSHRPFTLEGLRDEAIAYLRKHILFAPGRYLDLQLQNRVPKDKFISWYKSYSAKLQKEADFEHEKMLSRYRDMGFEHLIATFYLWEVCKSHV